MIVEFAFCTLLSESRTESFSDLCRGAVSVTQFSAMCALFIYDSSVCLPVLVLLFVLAEFVESHILIVEKSPGSTAHFLSENNFCDFLEIEVVLGSGSKLQYVFLNI